MVFFFYGDDTYRSYQKLKQVRNKFKQEVDSSGFNIVVIDGEKMDLEEFNQAVAQAGFLSDKRLVIVKNLFDNKSLTKLKNDLLDYLSKQKDSPEENYLLFWQSGTPRKNNPLFKKLNSFKYVYEFEPLKDNKLVSWAQAEISRRNGKINQPAVNELVTMVGNNLWQMSTEIDKLIAYKKGKTITVDDINLLVRGKLDENIFDLTDAISAHNKQQALKLLSDQLESGANEQYLLAMITRQFRIMLQLKSMLNSGISAGELAQQAGLHPFVVKKTTPLLNNYSIQELKKIYQRLTELDLNMKSSSIDSQALLDLFIIKT